MHRLYNNKLPKAYKEIFIKINKLHNYYTRLAKNTKYFQLGANKTFSQN